MGKKAREKQTRRERRKTRPIFVDEVDGDIFLRMKKDIQDAFEKGLKNLFEPPDKEKLRGQIDKYLRTACASDDVQE